MTQIMTCERVDELLADWLEGTLDAPAAEAVRLHLGGCARCGAMLASLDQREMHAAALPMLEPSRDLWTGIEERIVTPVVALAARPSSPVVTRRRFGWVAQAAAAVVLVTVTAGTTWMYAARVARSASGALIPDMVYNSGNSGAVGRQLGRISRVRAVTADGALTSVERTYDTQVGALRAVIAERRSELDPRTLAILEQNIQLIDRAIAQSREALARDPWNAFVGDELAVTLDKKIQLLRTAALLPPRA